MAKRERKNKKESRDAVVSRPVAAPSPAPHFRWTLIGLPLLLAAVAFVLYAPSLGAGFVYDGEKEILKEGFVTSPANLPVVFSTKVFAQNITLADRPGALLYLMLNAALWGRNPWGYHLAGNLLHAACAALLFALMRRLVTAEMPGAESRDSVRVLTALVIATLIFAVHPITVEPVSAINYSYDPLVTFFTVTGLLAATFFRPGGGAVSIGWGVLGVVCCFASVACKESGIATSLLLVLYWGLFRQGERRAAWFWFLGAGVAGAMLYLSVRFSAAPQDPNPPKYLGGSLGQMLLIQPRVWVFMMGKLLVPTHLSADYTLENMEGITLAPALVVLAVVVLDQGWLARKSRLGALGVATYWLGLAAVSNFTPLYRFDADRFYYLPLAGVAVQIAAVLLLLLPLRTGFWLAVAPLALAIVPFAWLNLERQKVFLDDFSLWQDTLQVSPQSWTAHTDYGVDLAKRKRYDEAVAQYRKVLSHEPNNADLLNNLANSLSCIGNLTEAQHDYTEAIRLDPAYADPHNGLGNLLVRIGEGAKAEKEYAEAIRLNPNKAEPYNGLGNALAFRGDLVDAAAEYRVALKIEPDYPEAHNGVANALLHQNQLAEALAQATEAVRLRPDYADAHCTLGLVLAQLGHLPDAVAQFETAHQLEPDNAQITQVLEQLRAAQVRAK